MTYTRFLLTTAAALLLGTGFSAAQQMQKDVNPARAPAAQQQAPAEKIAPPITQGARKSRETTGQGAPSRAGTGAAAPGLTGKPDVNQGAAEHNGMNKSSMDKSGGHAGESAAASGKAETDSTTGQGSASGKTETRSTTGQGAASGAAKLSTAQRSKIVGILHKHRVAPVHLNVSVHIGTRLPEHVHLYRLPLAVIDVYPEWRGYDYIMVGEQIVVIDPDSHEIVAILEA